MKQGLATIHRKLSLEQIENMLSMKYLITQG